MGLENATSNGVHYISAGAFGSNTGTYTLSVMPNDDFGETAGTAGAVSVGGSTTGNIESASDEDWFAVSLTGGQTYQIDLEGAPTLAGTLPHDRERIVGVIDRALSGEIPLRSEWMRGL